MERFWDERARENPYYFVDNRLEYEQPDMERFWEGGKEGLDTMLALLDLEVSPDDVVAEIGCGVGRVTRALAERASEVWAVEVSGEMLERAKGHNSQLSNVHWHLGDGETLAGIEDASIDGCVSVVVFQHIPNPDTVLSYVREMGRVLRPGGWAAFQISNDPTVHRPRGRWERARAGLRLRGGKRPGGQSHPAWLGTSVPLSSLRDTAIEAGLELGTIVGEGTQFCLVSARRLDA
jgi:SAM-dependent methyltransferase